VLCGPGAPPSAALSAADARVIITLRLAARAAPATCDRTVTRASPIPDTSRDVLFVDLLHFQLHACRPNCKKRFSRGIWVTYPIIGRHGCDNDPATAAPEGAPFTRSAAIFANNMGDRHCRQAERSDAKTWSGKWPWPAPPAGVYGPTALAAGSFRHHPVQTGFPQGRLGQRWCRFWKRR